MKAEVVQQRSLLELAELDAERSRLDHRATHLPEQRQVEGAQSAHREANDRLAAVQIALEDLDVQVAKFESEIDGVRQRGERDRSLLAAGTVDAKQLTDLQHELGTLERRQSSLEDSLLEVMERREELQSQQADELAEIDELQSRLTDAQRACDEARTKIDQLRHQSVSRRDELVAELDADLVALCQFLPGPASSQTGFSIGLLRAGWRGGIAAHCWGCWPARLSSAGGGQRSLKTAAGGVAAS